MTSNSNRATSSHWSTHQVTSFSQRLVYANIVRHQTTTSRQYALWLHLCKLLHFRIVFFKIYIATVAFASIRSPVHPRPDDSADNTEKIQEKHENIFSEVEKIWTDLFSDQVVLKPRRQHHVMITSNAYGLKITEPWTLSTSRWWV